MKVLCDKRGKHNMIKLDDTDQKFVENILIDAIAMF